MTIKLHKGEWWNMNSENTGPTIITSNDWHHLQGHIFTMIHTTPQFQGYMFQPEIHYQSTNYENTEPTNLVSDDDEPPTHKKPRSTTPQIPTSGKKRNSQNDIPLTPINISFQMGKN